MELLFSRLRHAKAGPLGAGNAARRRMRRIVGVRMGLLRHDGEVEGAVVEDDARGCGSGAWHPWLRTLCASACPKTRKLPSCSTSASGLAAAT